jgi:Tol biopolymer transport system component
MTDSSSLAGRSLGHYQIQEKIGAGGMGEVYRAHDQRLGRDVAVKVLPPQFSQDADRLRRFEQEARATAALNHPNILAIYDIGTQDGSPYIVSELLEGETLRQRLRAGALPPRQAQDFACQIAQGLAAAHEKHVIHRDLKPENIFLTRDGRAKILDFGLAKLTRRDQPFADEAATISATKAGAVMGTIGYMSPEQVRGQDLDHRSDIFSFGAILYEMLAGCSPFRGSTTADTITSILTADPPEFSGSRPSISPALERVVRHCLEKEPGHRFQSCRDLAFDLGALSEMWTASGRAAAVKPLLTSRLRKFMPISAALIILMVIVTAYFAGRGTETASAPAFHRLTFQRGTVYGARFSADAKSVVYSATWGGDQIQTFTVDAGSQWSRSLDLPPATILAVSPSGEMALALGGYFDRHFIVSNMVLARRPVEGGAPREVLENVEFADWSPQGELAVVHLVGGRRRLEFPIGTVLYETSGWISHIRISPRGDRIAFLDHPALSDDRGAVCVVDLAGKKTTLSDGWGSQDGLAWSSNGSEVWFTAIRTGYDRALMAVDLSGRLRTILRVPGGLSLRDIAPDGRVLVSLETQRLAMEGFSNQHPEPVDLSWFDWSIAKDISRDGQWVLFEESSEPAGPNYAVAIRKMDGSAPVKLGEGSSGGLSPDGKWAISIFTGTPERLALVPVGAGEPKNIPVTGIEHFQNGSGRFLPDGKRLVVNAAAPGGAFSTYLVDVAGGTPRRVTPEGVRANLPSPDGRMLAGISPEGTVTLYPIEGGDPQAVPGLAAGFYPLSWGRDAKTLYVYSESGLPSSVYRINLDSAKRELVKEIMPSDRAGIVYIGPMVATPDASAFAYSVFRSVSVLYVISGLR